MQKKTRSLLEELQSIGENKDINHFIESRASNVITSAINLIELMDKHYSSDKVEVLERKLLNAIKNKNQEKFTKVLRKKNNEDKRT
jgi:hypothetical protein